LYSELSQYPQLPRDQAFEMMRRCCGEVKIGDPMKYAIIESGGKQYRAVEGGVIEVDRLQAEIGDQLPLERVLLVVNDDDVSVGIPLVSGAKVSATVVSHDKGPKVIVFKYRPKKKYRVKTGHRQQYTRLKVDSIELE
jgi:large subunit ribosomal protein L21